MGVKLFGPPSHPPSVGPVPLTTPSHDQGGVRSPSGTSPRTGGIATSSWWSPTRSSRTAPDEVGRRSRGRRLQAPGRSRCTGPEARSSFIPRTGTVCGCCAAPASWSRQCTRYLRHRMALTILSTRSCRRSGRPSGRPRSSGWPCIRESQIWLVVIWKLRVGLGVTLLGRKAAHELGGEDDRGLVNLLPGEQIDQHLPGGAGHRDHGVDDGGQRG